MANLQKTRIALATTLWQRPTLTDAVLFHYSEVQRKLSSNVELVLLAVGSEGQASRELSVRHRFHYIEHENQPVTDKWNAVISEAKRWSPDAVVVVNSDDIVSANLFTVFADRLSRGADYFGLRGTFVFDLTSGLLGLWPGYEASYLKFRIGEPAGCARCFSRKLLESTGWRLWPPIPKVNKSMDFWCTQYLSVLGFEPEAWSMEELGVEAIQIKSDTNITPFNRLPLRDLYQGEHAWEIVGRITSPETTAKLRILESQLLSGRSNTPFRYIDSEREAVYKIEDLTPPIVKHRTLLALRAMRSAVLAEQHRK